MHQITHITRFTVLHIYGTHESTFASERHVSRCLKFMCPAIWLNTRQVFGGHKKCKQKPFLPSSCTHFWLLKGLHIPAAHTFEASKCKQEAIQPVHLCCTLLLSWPAWIKTRGLQLTHQFSSFRPLRGHPANLSSKK